MRKLEEGNFRNVKGRRGIPLFIGRKSRHSNRHNQSRNDTWHVPRKNKSTRLVSNKIVTCGTLSVADVISTSP